jgi:hypothetical protein
MAKPLVLQFGDRDLPFNMNKVDRSKLYGYKEVEALDDHGRVCELATLVGDGRTVVGKGGSGLGQLDADGCWVEKSALKPVDLEGREIQPVPSSFSVAPKLFETATVEEYLRHTIRSAYQLTCEEEIADLTAELERGTIFKFPYSFRGGLEADAAFMLMAEDKSIFMLVGSPTKVEFIGLAQVAAVEEEDAGEEADMMDFDMI